MKTIISSAILLLFSTNNFIAQSRQVSLMPSFVQHQIKNYGITYSVRLRGNGTEEIMSTTKKQIKIKVVTIHEDFIDMEWRYDKIEFTQASSQNNPFTVLMNTLSAGITVKYSINKKGVINSITNREEIKANVMKSVEDKLTSMANEGSLDPSTLSHAKFQFQMMFLAPSQIEKIVINDLFKFHQLYGKEYSDKPSEMVVEHGTLLETYDVRLKSIDPLNQTCIIVSNLINDTSKEINNSFEYNLSDCWLINHHSKITSFDPLDVIQLYQIQLLP